MASDGTSGSIPVASLVQGSQAASIKFQAGNGQSLPQSGKSAFGAAPPAAAVTQAGAASPASRNAAQPATDPESLVSQLNKYLNTSGRPDQFRVDPANGNLIQQVNPATGAVIGEFSTEAFPALARSVGASSLLIDSLA